MKDTDRLKARFLQFGGMRLVWQYARMGVLWTGLKEIIRCAVTGRSFKQAYPVITKRIDEILLDKYGDICSNNRLDEEPADTTHENKIWVCWLQGYENAPEMVKVCIESQRRMFGDDNVVVLDDQNYKQWVQLPEHVEEKYRRGWIPGVSFTDILRLELLIKYGGTWIDSSVLITPPVENGVYYPTIDGIMNSNLFLFRYYNKGRAVGISSWFIHSKPRNPLLMDLRDILIAYWKDYDCTIEYYIFHLFFSHVAKRYPEMIQIMPKGNSYHSIMLGQKLDKTYDESSWQNLLKHVMVHKMNYRQEKKFKSNPNSYWNHIVKEYPIR